MTRAQSVRAESRKCAGAFLDYNIIRIGIKQQSGILTPIPKLVFVGNAIALEPQFAKIKDLVKLPVTGIEKNQ